MPAHGDSGPALLDAITMRTSLTFALLMLLKIVSRIFYRIDWHWVGDVPAGHRWQPFRLVAILNHTSLYEVLLAGGPTNSFLRRMSKRGVVPVASKTLERPIVGKIFSVVAANVVSVSRERDGTWEKVLRSIDPDSMVVILPEGRMKRADGNDASGKPMTVRGGIADVIETIGEGSMLLAFSEGLHHIQVPGQLFPKLFKPIRLRLEAIDLKTYRERLRQEIGDAQRPQSAFRKAVIRDLTARRDRYCAADFDTTQAVAEFKDGRRTPGH